MVAVAIVGVLPAVRVGLREDGDGVFVAGLPTTVVVPGEGVFVPPKVTVGIPTLTVAVIFPITTTIGFPALMHAPILLPGYMEQKKPSGQFAPAIPPQPGPEIIGMLLSPGAIA